MFGIIKILYKCLQIKYITVMENKKKIAIIIPAHNEEQTIKDVILDFWETTVG